MCLYSTSTTVKWLCIPLFCAGYYVYIETSWQSPNDTAVLESVIVPKTSGKPNSLVCLQFWYHMHGQHVDTLNLYMKQGQQLPASPIWTKSGTQGNKWRLGQIAVTSTTPFKVRKNYWILIGLGRGHFSLILIVVGKLLRRFQSWPKDFQGFLKMTRTLQKITEDFQ